MNLSDDEEEEYQGWSNVDTWSVALFASNEYAVYEATGNAADAGEMEEIVRPLYPSNFTFEDPDWSKVNWQEIWEDRHNE